MPENIYQPVPGEFYVYVYWNPLKPGCPPFYVGKGKDRRAFNHLEPSQREKNNHKARTILKIRQAGINPRITCAWYGQDEAHSLKVEKLLVALWGRSLDGGILTNLTKGGDGVSGLINSPETRLRKSKAKKGIRFSEEHKRKIGDAQRGKPKHTDEAKQRFREMNLGRTKLVAEQINEIRQRVANGEKQNAMALEYGVGEATISQIVNHRGNYQS